MSNSENMDNLCWMTSRSKTAAVTNDHAQNTLGHFGAVWGEYMRE